MDRWTELVRSGCRKLPTCALILVLSVVAPDGLWAQQLRPVQPATRTEPVPFTSSGNAKQIPLPSPPHELPADKTSSGARTVGAIISVVASLAVVLGLFLVLAWLMRRGMPNATRRLPNEVVDVLGRAPLAGRQQMHVLRFGNKLVLVCASPAGVDALAEITDPIEIDRLAGLCTQQEPYSATSAFKQVFGQLAREKTSSGRPSAVAKEAADV